MSTFSIASVLRLKPIIIGGGTDSTSANSEQGYEGQIAACMTGFLRDMLVRMMKIMLSVCCRNST